MLAIAVSGDPPPLRERSSPPMRLLRRLRLLAAGGRAALRARRAERSLVRAGLTTRRLGIGDRNGGYAVTLSGPTARRSPEQVVVGGRAPLGPTILERIVADAGDRLGERLVIGPVRVLATGTLMAEVRAPARATHLIRVDLRPPADDPLARLLGCAPGAAVTSRLVLPQLRGRVGEHVWTLEDRRPGVHPATMTGGLWTECTDFLEALWSVAPPEGAGDAPPIGADLARVERWLPDGLAAGVRDAARQADATLAGVRRGWGHGDFHPGNLLVGDHLDTVLDWDAASPWALPLLDVLHLTATTHPQARRLPHGARCTRVLWPLARRGGDERLRAHCDAIGVDPRPDALAALVLAYWLTRVARDIATFADRVERPEWLRLNLGEPARQVVRGP